MDGIMSAMPSATRRAEAAAVEKGGRGNGAVCLYKIAWLRRNTNLWMIFALNDIFARLIQKVIILCRAVRCRAIAAWGLLTSISPLPRCMEPLFWSGNWKNLI